MTVVDVDGSGPLAGVTQIAPSSLLHACATLGDGHGVCWGRNADGELGDGTATDRTMPTVVVSEDGTGPLGDVASIAAGYYNSCALLTSGQVRCWGLALAGALGDGSGASSNRPVVVANEDGTGPLAGATQIAAGYVLSCARLADSEARCWGQTPDYDSWHPRPTPVPNPD